MKLRIRLFAALRERAGVEEVEVDALPEALDVGGLKRALEERFPEWGSLAHVRGVIDAAYAPDDAPVRPGSEVALLPPVSGGAPASEPSYERGVFELVSAPIDPAAIGERVAHPSCGAVVVFTGRTRERNRGKDVARLDYEAFAEMAGAEMARVFARCLERFGPESGGEEADPERALRMLCQHRTGVVEVGEPSVAIAVASPHRAAAFDACRFLIDELKASLPVWKKEVYGDGHHWIGDRS